VCSSDLDCDVAGAWFFDGRIVLGQHAVSEASMTNRKTHPVGAWIVLVLIVPMLIATFGVVLALTTDADLPFDNAHLWWLIGFVPLASLLGLYGFYRRRRAMDRFAPGLLGTLLTESFSPSKQALRAGLFVTALFFLVAAIIRFLNCPMSPDSA